MEYNPNIHHRRSIRLKGYDYSQIGLYFITICLQGRACLFGEISTGKYNATIGDIVDWVKTMTTNEYIRGVKTLGWPGFDKKLRQRNYWEYIIRDEQSYQTISEYIIDNPAKWKNDKFYNQ